MDLERRAIYKRALKKQVRSSIWGRGEAFVYNKSGKNRTFFYCLLSHLFLIWHTYYLYCTLISLDKGTDVVLIQKLPGHNDIKTTLRYLHVTNRDLQKVLSPLEDITQLLKWCEQLKKRKRCIAQIKYKCVKISVDKKLLRIKTFAYFWVEPTSPIRRWVFCFISCSLFL